VKLHVKEALAGRRPDAGSCGDSVSSLKAALCKEEGALRGLSKGGQVNVF
jgi:hypothetical protein